MGAGKRQKRRLRVKKATRETYLGFKTTFFGGFWLGTGVAIESVSLRDNSRDAKTAKIGTFCEEVTPLGIQIGTLALEAGIITKDQLNFALSLQRSNDRRPIGEILVGSGLIRPGLRDRLLGVQAARLFGVSRGS